MKVAIANSIAFTVNKALYESMKSNNSVIFALLAVMHICFLQSSIQSCFAEKRPNIILILTDDHRYDALGYIGHPFLETPHLDKLAADGIHFENAYVTTSLCSPSRASILTGLYAHNHNVVDNYHPVDDQLVFFPELLQETGYQTAFVGKWHMGDTDEKQRGFDHWVSFKGQGIYWPHEDGLKVKGRYVPQAYKTGFNVNGTSKPQKGYITDELTDYAVEWLEAQESDKDSPFFLYLSHKAAHADFLPPNRHAFKYENVDVKQPSSWFDSPDDFQDVPMWVKNQRNSRHGVEFAYYTELNLTKYYKRYCETLLAVDDSVGRVIQTLDKKGLSDNTVILYMGDNGFLFGEHGLIDKRCTYEESIRVPMILKGPGILSGGKKMSQIVANIDVAPTLLEIASIPAPPEMDGQSFLSVVNDPKNKWRDYLLYEYFWERNYPQTPTMHAIFNDKIKYTRYHGIWDVDELYDLENDPHEKINLIHHPDWQDKIVKLNSDMFEMLQNSSGMNLRLLEDRGNKFYHRKVEGSKGAGFPDWFYREAGTSGK